MLTALGLLITIGVQFLVYRGKIRELNTAVNLYRLGATLSFSEDFSGKGAKVMSWKPDSARWKIRSVQFPEYQVPKEAFEALLKTSPLEWVDVPYQLSAYELRSIVNIRSLKALHIDAGALGEGDFACLHGLPLESLRVRNCRFVQELLAEVGHLPLLEELYLEDASFAEPSETIRQLSSLKRVQRVSLDGANLRNEHISSIVELAKSLHYLSLRGTEISDSGIGVIVEECPNCTVDH